MTSQDAVGKIKDSSRRGAHAGVVARALDDLRSRIPGLLET